MRLLRSRDVRILVRLYLALSLGLFALWPRHAVADATVTVRSAGWSNAGWPAGNPSLTVGGVNVAADVATRVSASPQLARATVAVGKVSVTFLVALRDGHRYVIESDPCCFLTVTDEDDSLVKHAVCGTADSCPARIVQVDRFVYRKEGCLATCAPPAMMRVRGTAELSWNDDASTVASADYREAPSGRHSPEHLVVRRGGRVVLDTLVIMRLGEHYTLTVPDRGDPALSLD